VLVIDDEADAREALEILLRQWGCLALTADSASGALALARTQDNPIDAILADYRLRENHTGIEAIAALRREFGPIPAAIVTGDTAPDRLKQASDSGYVLLHKPLDPLRLKGALCRLLGERRGGG
jgi:CheY-like chemotaxis protein